MSTAPFYPSFIHVLIASALSVLVGVFPFFRRRTRITKVFAIANVMLALMAVSEGVGLIPMSHAARLLILRISYPISFAALNGFGLFMLDMSEVPPERRRIWKYITGLGLLCSILAFTPWLVT